jgi:hypothetical protein
MNAQLKNLVYLFVPFFSVPLFGAGCEAAVGQWKWFNGGVLTLQQNQTIQTGGKPAGKWECTNPARGVVTLRWTVGYVDTLTIAGDRMVGKNQQGVAVSGTRVGKRQSGGK